MYNWLSTSILLGLVFAFSTVQAQRVRSTPTPAGRMHFSGEMVPTEQADVSMKLAVTLASSGGYLRHVNGLKQRSAPYFAIIEPILARHKVPNDFKYLPLIESNWKADAVSTAGAVGYWQFMDETAKDMGLKINGPVDERKDLRKSTEAAARYIKFLYNKLGSWTLVAAAYNGGIGMLQNKMRRAGHRDYYALTLNEETGYYLYRILAMKELFNRANYYAGMADSGLMASIGNPYERERAQAREMGWLRDTEPELTGTPVGNDPFMAVGNRPESVVMDSVLVRLLASNTPAEGGSFSGDVSARLLKAGKSKLGERWSFKLTQDITIGEDEFRAGDVLYALVDDVDARGMVYLRATKLVSSVSNAVVPVTLLAMNPRTGLAGIAVPKAPQPDWEVSWKVQ
ncbi:transglycosylase SLT domain-containing protein [Rudanella paleaurantiibacter]|uniref:Transglycosylase SLT domain-containing protein n=2 Tax=Rudanella paleaurantiibacter TaxID=2614655 RepID=A0A7J5TXN1_9BACT|nr:transglycosylase SLT domain-containing protein [Rudanella paleaurantiibacter]